MFDIDFKFDFDCFLEKKLLELLFEAFSFILVKDIIFGMSRIQWAEEKTKWNSHALINVRIGGGGLIYSHVLHGANVSDAEEDVVVVWG